MCMCGYRRPPVEDFWERIVAEELWIEIFRMILDTLSEGCDVINAFSWSETSQLVTFSLQQ